jgi:protein-tyrosine phosphatase
MIDCHNHTLPGIDDGAHDVEMAMEMAQCAVKHGIHTIVCTPHHLNGVFENAGAAVLAHVAALRSRLTAADIPLEVLPGSELHLVPELPERILEGDALTYADHGNTALVELPKHTVPTGTETILERLLYQDITPVIAHPERNSELIRDPDRLTEWVGWGCKVQLTAQSCSGDFGKRIQSQCRRWCEQGHVHLIASDAHRPYGRAPILTDGVAMLREWLGEQAVEILSTTNPRKLTVGEPLLSITPAPVKRKSIRNLFG